MKCVHPYSTLRCLATTNNNEDPATPTQRLFCHIPIFLACHQRRFNYSNPSSQVFQVTRSPLSLSSTVTQRRRARAMPPSNPGNFKALHKALATFNIASPFSDLTSFSYSENREFEFSNLVLRYYIDPPPGARLFSMDKKTEGRVGSLLRAHSRAKTLGEIGVVSWRGS